MSNYEFGARAPLARVETLAPPRDASAERRIAARIADKYMSGESRDPETAKRKRAQEVARLEISLEHVRRGLGDGVLGRGGRQALLEIEKILERDYGLYGKIRPINK